MATQYTPILQLALPVTGELNGTWGDVVNDNITSMVEQAIAGLATISTWTANSHTLTTADGTTDEARCAMLVAATGAGGTALTAAGEIICPARTKLFVLQNGSAYAVTLKTSAGTGTAVAAGDTAFLFCDGTNVNACVTQIVNGHITGNLTVDGNTTLGNTTSDTITATARIASDLNPSADNTYDLGTSGNSWRNLFIDGTATIASLVATTADINGGTIDGTTVGASSASTGRFTQVNITGQGDLRLEDTSGGEYVALQAPGTLAASYTLTLPVDDGTNGQALITDGFGNLSWSTAASGDVYGPSSATDNAVARFDGTTGKIIQNSAVTIGDDGATVIAANSTSDALRITQTGSGNALVVEDSANPDATPFVVNTNGQVISGATTAQTSAFSVIPQLQINGTGAQETTIGLFRWSNNTGQPTLNFDKSRGASVGTRGIVQSADVLGYLSFEGDDGTNFIRAASISSEVDGTPGTNDMPGRLVFSTTADGASSPTERMRITNAGQFGINGAPSSGNYQFQLGGTIISAGTASYGFVVDTTVPSASTASANMFYTTLKTQAAAFTLGTATHFSASQGTIGSGSAITSQYGFIANSTLTGATNNYGFYSNIASGTGRWNFYAAGSADNYFSGRIRTGSDIVIQNSAPVLYIGDATVSTGDCHLEIGSGRTGSGNAYVDLVGDTTYTDYGIRIQRESSGTNAASAFYHRGTGDFRFYAFEAAPIVFSTTGAERMRIDSAGRVGIGQASVGATLNIQKIATGGANISGVYNVPTFQSDVTGVGVGFWTNMFTAAASFTMSNMQHYRADQGAIGAGSTVTNQMGYAANPSLTGATNNYGFYSAIASGTGRYNFYASGSADNYFAGNVGIGTTPGVKLDVSYADSSYNAGIKVTNTSNTSGSQAKIYAVNNAGDYISIGRNSATLGSQSQIFSTGAYPLEFYTNSTLRATIDSSGNVIQSAPTTAPTLSTNGTMVFNLTSNTNLRVSVRGSDGVTRTANITLA